MKRAPSTWAALIAASSRFSSASIGSATSTLPIGDAMAETPIPRSVRMILSRES